MTTVAEITELKAEMDAKFDRVFGELAEVKTDAHGFGKDVKGLGVETGSIHQRTYLELGRIAGRLGIMDGKLDKLLKAHGIDDGDSCA